MGSYDKYPLTFSLWTSYKKLTRSVRYFKTHLLDYSRGRASTYNRGWKKTCNHRHVQHNCMWIVPKFRRSVQRNAVRWNFGAPWRKKFRHMMTGPEIPAQQLDVISTKYTLHPTICATARKPNACSPQQTSPEVWWTWTLTLAWLRGG